MNILLIHQYFLELDDGGGSRFNEMTKQWSTEGHRVMVIAGMMHANAMEKRSEYKGKYFVKKNHEAVQVIRCHVSESYNKNFLGRLWGYLSFMFSSLYAGLFKTKGKFDVVLVTSPPLFVGVSAYLISRLKRIPMIFEVRDLWPESAIDAGVLNNKYLIRLSFWFEKFIYKKAQLINVLTPAFRKRLIQVKKAPSEKIIFIPNAADFVISDKLLNNGFDIDAFRKSQSLENKTVITYVGAHGVANHLIQVLETAELIKDTLPQVLFLLIGDGMQKEMLVQKAASRNLKNIRFLDPVPKNEVFKYILASDFGASILKKGDTFKTIYSNKTFDYMACKKPIFLLIDGVSRELIEAAKCGMYVEPENPQEWASKIELMLKKSSDELIQMGENGYRHAKKYFDRSRLAKKYVQQIEEKVLGV